MDNTRFSYYARTSKIRTNIDFIERQIQQHLVELNKSKKNRKIYTLDYFQKNYAVKKLKLNQVFLYLLINRISYQIQEKKNPKALQEARKEISQILTYWEDDLSKNFLPLYEDDYPIHHHSNNLKVAEHFKCLGLAMDTIVDSYTETRKKATFMRLQLRFLISFCNALNFKILIKDVETLGPSYAMHQNILVLIKENFDSCINNYWTTSISMPANEVNIYEMRIALSLIDFIKRFSSILFNREDHENYKKRYAVWKSYIDKIEAEIE